MEEFWKDIPNHKGYQASNTGKIRSFWKRNAGPYPILLDSPTELKIQIRKRYDRVKILGKPKPVHFLILITFRGFPEKGLICRHLDGNRKNNNIENLAWGTSKENSDDMLKHGTRAKGEKHYASKLTRKDVEDIRNSDKTDREQSEYYNVSISCIYHIKTFTKWNDGQEIQRYTKRKE